MKWSYLLPTDAYNAIAKISFCRLPIRYYRLTVNSGQNVYLYVNNYSKYSTNLLTKIVLLLINFVGKFFMVISRNTIATASRNYLGIFFSVVEQF